MGFEFLESIEGTSSKTESISSAIEISDTQLSYLKELNVPSENWVEMTDSQKDLVFSRISDRLDEMGICGKEVMDNAVKSSFTKEISDSFCNRIEGAPHDIEQIDRISDVLVEMRELRFENWEQLSLDNRVKVLNNLESKVAEISCRPSCPVKVVEDGPIDIEGGQVYGRLGGYSQDYKDIRLNADMLGSNDPIVFKETLDTVIHEGRHAYQDYNVNECEVHSRHSEVVSWSENMEGGKWGYCGSSSTLLGQRLYEQQAVEIDARNFAADVMDRFEDKLWA